MNNEASRGVQLAIWVSAIGYFVDLFDTFLFPSVRVVSLRELGVLDADSLSVYAMIMRWQLGGMVIGALFLWGPLADRFGRRKILLGSIIMYSVACILTAGVQDVWQYASLRFVTGVGLGGELGAGITLISENMHREKRSMGSMIIGACGMLGVVVAALLAKTSLDWRVLYVIGGLLGFVILAVRVGVPESTLFANNRAERPEFGRILRFLFTKGFWRFLACVLVGTPTFFISGLVVPAAPEFGRAWGMAQPPLATTGLIFTYLSIAAGDIACGALSMWLRSRKAALLIFLTVTTVGICTLVFMPPTTPFGFYWRCALAGFGIGFWANMVQNAAEQFGTNVRATVTITVPNLVRFLLVPITFAYEFLKPLMGMTPSAATVGLACAAIGIVSTLALKDNFAKELDYNEPI